MKPYRGIAKGGVVTDIDPYNLPLGAWSWGQNVRFRNQSITRAPVFRSAKTALMESAPRFLTANIPSSGFDTLIIGYLNGRVTSLASGTETDLSVSGYSNSNADTPFTSCELDDVLYVNRSDRAPWALLPGAGSFATIANWQPVDGPWTCGILRALNDALLAYNVTQNGTNFPTMVLTSEFATADNEPLSWNYTLGTNNATQNTLGEMQGPITDACALGQQMIVYGQTEAWIQYLTGDDNIWGYVPLFKDQGAISTNCVVEVDRKHYVFGLDDIWMHDGNSKTSICDERVREFIFGGIMTSNAVYCRAVYNKVLKEIYFQYPSNDQFCSFTLGSNLGCNRQATYHIPTGTWSFDDLPYVFGATMGNLNNSRTWATDSITWATSGGTWASLNNGIKRIMAMVGDVNSTYSLSESVYAFDLQGPGSMSNYAVDLHATMGWTLIRDGIDLDELGADLYGYKLLSSIVPRGRMEAAASPISFTVGSSDAFNEPVVYGVTQTWDGMTLNKIDVNAAGRYMSLKLQHNDYHYVNLTGFDLDLGLLAEPGSVG